MGNISENISNNDKKYRVYTRVCARDGLHEPDADKSEKTIERHLTRSVERLGGLCVKFPPLFFAGFPDRIVLLPGGRLVFVELKAPGKKAREVQTRVHDRLRGLGFRVEVLDTCEAVDSFVETL